jgi:hypothetical protein
MSTRENEVASPAEAEADVSSGGTRESGDVVSQHSDPPAETAREAPPGDSVSQLSTSQVSDSASAAGSSTGRQDDYFPLGNECRWDYKLEVVGPGDATKTMSAVKFVKGSKDIGGKRYAKIVTEVTGGPMRVPDQHYRVADDGVYAAVEGAPGKELLILPFRPEEQESWRGEALPAISSLSGQATAGEQFAEGDNQFSDCIRVSLDMTVVQPGFFGATKVPVRFERWFAAGVGLVREVRIVGEEGKPDYLKTDSKLIRWSGSTPR